MKKMIALFLGVSISFNMVFANNLPEISSESYILMDLSGNIIFAENENEKREPASVTKIMTMLLIMESIESGEISYEDMVVISSEAEKQGGSQVFLEAGEIMSVDELLKCIAVSSANDAAVALAEFLEGSHDNFVDKMNEKAKELGMENTTFKNATGLPEEGHETTALDISKMSLELLKYDDILNYTTIWTDSIRGGEFDLANTNKLLKTYNGMNGLKTGYTSTAKYCIASSATRGEESFLAIVMGAETTDARNQDITKMLDYAFNNFKTFLLKNIEIPTEITVLNGKSENVKITTENSYEKVLISKNDNVEYEVNLPLNVTAPIEKGEILGEILIKVDNEILRKVDIIAHEQVGQIEFFDVLVNFFISFFLNKK